MSIKSWEDACASLRTLPAEEQRKACEFIESLERRSRRRPPAALKSVRADSRRKPQPKKQKMGDWIHEDGLWVYHGDLPPDFDLNSGRKLEHQRQMNRVLNGIKPAKP